MIIPSSNTVKAALAHNRSVFDLKSAGRRDSELAPSFVSTVPPPYESRPGSLAINDAGELLAVPPGVPRSDTSSYEWGSDDGYSHRDSGSDYASTAGSVVHRHRFHWHSDARRETVVLQVQNVLFKIQPAILESYNFLLAELMRGIKSNPSLFRESIETCKTYHLPDARAQDVAELLNRIYHLHSRNAADTQVELSLRSTAAVVTPVLHFATKHSSVLRTKCVHLMEKIIPSNTPALISRNRKGALRCQGDTAFRILNLVRSAGPEARALLPFAFFLCARAATADIVESPFIGWEDKALCLAGRDEISRRLRFDIYRKYTASETFSPQHCLTNPKCCTSVAAARTLDKHLSMEIFGFFTKVDCVCCAACAREMQNEVKENWLGGIWDNLPQLFRLGTWEGLRQQRLPGG